MCVIGLETNYQTWNLLMMRMLSKNITGYQIKISLRKQLEVIVEVAFMENDYIHLRRIIRPPNQQLNAVDNPVKATILILYDEERINNKKCNSTTV